MTINKFDSQLEAKWSPALQRIGFRRDTSFLPAAFEDIEGTTYNAKADFYHEDLDLYVELKSSSLNGIKAKRTADNQCADIIAYSGYLTTHQQLEKGWNHSAHKQAWVQEAMGGKTRYIVAFDKMPDARTQKRLANAKLDWMMANRLHYYTRTLEISKFFNSD